MAYRKVGPPKNSTTETDFYKSKTHVRLAPSPKLSYRDEGLEVPCHLGLLLLVHAWPRIRLWIVQTRSVDANDFFTAAGGRVGAQPSNAGVQLRPGPAQVPACIAERDHAGPWALGASSSLF